MIVLSIDLVHLCVHAICAYKFLCSQIAMKDHAGNSPLPTCIACRKTYNHISSMKLCQLLSNPHFLNDLFAYYILLFIFICNLFSFLAVHVLIYSVNIQISRFLKCNRYTSMSSLYIMHIPRNYIFVFNNEFPLNFCF